MRKFVGRQKLYYVVCDEEGRRVSSLYESKRHAVAEKNRIVDETGDRYNVVGYGKED